MNPPIAVRAVVLLLILALLAVALPFRLGARRHGGTPSRRAEGWIAVPLRVAGLGFWGATIAWIAAPGASWLVPLAPSLPVRIAGLALAALGVALARWTFASLGDAITDTVVVRPGFALVTTGPYRWIRHPLYAATALASGGLVIASGSGLLATLALATAVLLAIRTRREERHLLERYGGDYRAWRARTPAIVPDLGARGARR